MIMKIAAYINKLFPKPVVHTEAEDKLLEKNIVKRYATGSIALSLGRYVTGKEIKQRRDEITSYRF